MKRKNDFFINQKEVKKNMKETKPNKPQLTDKDLVEALLLISETSKTLALEVMLSPDKTDSKEGGIKDVKKSNSSQ